MKLKTNLKILIVSVSLIIFSCKDYESEDSTPAWDENSDTTTITDIDNMVLTKDSENESINEQSFEVPFRDENGVKVIEAWLNGLGLEMIFDSGASTTCLSITQAEYMFKTGKLTREDVIGEQNFQIADGSIKVGLVINLKDVKIGSKIIHDVQASVSDEIQAPLLLGQSVMERFGTIIQDNNKGVIIFNEE